MLAVALIGGGILLGARMTDRSKDDLKHPSQDQLLTQEHMAQMETFGVNASAWHNLLNEQFLMGHAVTDQTHITHASTRGKTPVEVMGPEVLELTQFDRTDKLFSLNAQRGAIRSHGALPIAVSLSGELHHPRHPEQHTFFLATTYLDNEPTYGKVMAALRAAESPDPERSQRRFPGVEFYNRAPFQSFRYSG